MCCPCLHVPFTYLVIALIEFLLQFKISIKEYSSWLTEKPARLKSRRLANQRSNVVSLIFCSVMNYQWSVAVKQEDCV